MIVRLKTTAKDISSILLLGRVKQVWAKFGNDITRGLQSASGLEFSNDIVASVFANHDSSSLWSGRAGITGKKAMTITLPINAPNDLILWLLVHELGHRLLEQNDIRSPDINDQDFWDENEHKLLFSFLIEAIYSSFDDTKARFIIKNYPEIGYTDINYGHTRAWRWAISLSPEERHNNWLSMKDKYHQKR